MGWDDKKECPEYIPSGKPWRTHSIDAKPIPHFLNSPSDNYKLKLEIAKTYHWIIKSPFSADGLWYVGLTPLNTTGWNGIPDYESSGKTEMEAVCNVVLKLYRNEQENQTF